MNGVAFLTTRDWSAALPLTVDACSCGTVAIITAVWSGPLSAMIRLVWVRLSAPTWKWNRSGYWWRTASEFASQLALRSRTSSTPLVYLTILYGPDETGPAS